MFLACCSFQCLRFSNFLSYPDIETIQALLMLVNFLRNQADASASWSILGNIWEDVTQQHIHADFCG